MPQGETVEMASLRAAKQQLRSVMKQRLGAISQESIELQSFAVRNKLKAFRPYVDATRISVFLSMPTGEIQTDVIVRDALQQGKHVFVPYLHKNPAAARPAPDAESGLLPPRVMDMVRLRDLDDYETLRPDRWGIPSVDANTVHERERVLGGFDHDDDDDDDDDNDAGPDGTGAEAAIGLDLVLMPGVAFDVGGDGGVRRLGHGRGFYDYFVSRYRAKMAAGDARVPLLYGLALGEQFLSEEDEKEMGAGVGAGSVPVGPLDERLDGLILGSGEVVLSRR